MKGSLLTTKNLALPRSLGTTGTLPQGFPADLSSLLEAIRTIGRTNRPVPAVAIHMGSTHKVISLLSLVLQNTMLVLFMKYTRTRKAYPMYSASSAVFMSELLKVVICVSVLLMKMPVDDVVAAFLVDPPKEYAKVAVLALFYTIQNILSYVAVSNLQPATYQLLAQLKILTTAIFSVLILNKHLSPVQWGALALLVTGVSLVQLAGVSSVSTQQNSLTGVAATLAICLLSGSASVYFELMLKTSNTSIWVRNVQLATLSLLYGSVIQYFQRSLRTAPQNFLHGYDAYVFFVIFLHAGGGLIVAAVMKYADNILKCFATSVSVVLSSLVSIMLFDFLVTGKFIAGAFLVLLATYAYNNHQLFARCISHISSQKYN